MRKNYHEVREQRELIRELRQQEKPRRRTACLNAAAPAVGSSESDSVAAADATVGAAS